jgi:hypothetical protein
MTNLPIYFDCSERENERFVNRLGELNQQNCVRGRFDVKSYSREYKVSK